MAGQVIGPVTGDATPALGSQRAPQLAKDALPPLRAFIIQFVRPQRQDAGKFGEAVIGSRRPQPNAGVAPP